MRKINTAFNFWIAVLSRPWAWIVIMIFIGLTFLIKILFIFYLRIFYMRIIKLEPIKLKDY
mgnify:CR=1 FL=1